MEPFLDFVWGVEPCKVQIARMKNGDPDTFKRVVAEWPKQKGVILESVRENAAQGYDVFFGPAILRLDATDGSKAAVSGTRVLWADFDGGAPDNWAEFSRKQGIPHPSAIVRSSVPDRQHVYWALKDPIYGDANIDAIENRNRSLAARIGADKSGWDANQLLRIPGTTNFGWAKEATHKPWFREPVEVETVAAFGTREYNFSDFEAAPDIQSPLDRDISDRGIVPVSVVLAGHPLVGNALDIFTRTADEAKTKAVEGRSGSLMALIYTLIEQSYSDEHIFSLAYDAAKRWGKYFDSRPEAAARKQIAKDIALAHTKVSPLDGAEAFVEKAFTNAEPVEPTELRIWSFDEFMAEPFKWDWIVKDMLTTTGFGMFTGQPNVGKTTQSLHLGMSMASGVDYIDYEISEPSRVLLLSLEMPGPGIQHFLKDLATPYDKKLLNENFKMAVPGEMVNLNIKSARDWLDRTLRDQKPTLLLIDSMRYLMPSLSEEKDVRPILSFLQEMRNKHDMAMMIVHHDRKRQQGHTNGESSDLYGSQHIAADADYALSWYEQEVVRGNPDTKMVFREEIKNRYQAKKPPIPTQYSQGDRRVITVGKYNSDEEGTDASSGGSGSDSPRQPDDPGPVIGPGSVAW